MKLQTSIPPRRDGTVRVTGKDGRPHVFMLDDEGELTCDVADEATVAFLLESQHFWPADPEDAERAMALVKKPQAEESGEADDEEGVADGDEEMPANALPVEANTPPVRRKPGPKPKAK